MFTIDLGRLPTAAMPHSVVWLVRIAGVENGLLMIPAVEIDMRLGRGDRLAGRYGHIAHAFEACTATDRELIDCGTLQMRFTSHDIHSLVE